MSAQPQQQIQQPPPPPPSAPAGARPRDSKVLVGAILVLVAAALTIHATYSHSWLVPSETREGVSGGMGLWSTVMEHAGNTHRVPHTDLVSAVGGDGGETAKAAMFAYGSMIFFVFNWLFALLFALGALTGLLRFMAARSAGVPFALTLIPAIAGVVCFGLWFVVSVLVPGMLDGAGPGAALFVWWIAVVLAVVGAILFAKGRSTAAFGAGFQGRGAGMMPPGSGVVGGPQVLLPGAGVISNPADALGPPGGGRPQQ